MNQNNRSRKTQSLAQSMQQMQGVQLPKTEPILTAIDRFNYPLKAVYPMLDSTAQAETLRRYKHFEKNYNQKVSNANREITDYNGGVAELLGGSPDPHLLLASAKFEEDYRAEDNWTYNKKAVSMNLKLGARVIKLKRIQPLRDIHEVMFKLILWDYSDKLRKLTNNRRAARQNYMRSVPQIDINTAHLRNCKGVDELQMTHVCNETLLNRKKRLEEAGVLMNKVFRGNKRGVLYHLNPEILAVIDCFDEKLVASENQLVIPVKTKKFGDAYLTTSSLNDNLVKDPNRSIDKDSLTTAQNSFPAENKTRTPIGTVNGLAPSAKKNEEKISPAKNSSEKLRQSIKTPYQLAKKLAQNEYLDYKPVPNTLLQEEATAGNLSNAEFRLFLIAEIFKLVSKIYKNKTVFAGEWAKAYLIFEEQVFKTNKGQTFTKTTALRYYEMFEFALMNPQYGAVKCAWNTKFSAAMPSWYLDPLNKQPGSFRYWLDFTLERFKEQQKKKKQVLQNQALDRKKQSLRAVEWRKFNYQLKLLQRGKLSLDQLTRYVDYNLSPYFQKNLAKLLENHQKGLLKSA